MLPTPKNAPARRFGDAMPASSRKGSGMGTPSLKLNTYQCEIPEKWYQVARTLPNLKGGMYSSPEIHGFSPGGFQYGVFRISVRIPIFAMARMSPRESHFLVVDVVRWARNLHMFKEDPEG